MPDLNTIPPADLEHFRSMGYSDAEIAQSYQPPQVQQEQQIGTGATIGRTLVAHGGGILGGGGGALGGALLGSTLGPVGTIIGGIAGGAGGGLLGQKAQEVVEPTAVSAAQQQAAEEAARQNPKTALATDIIASAVASGGKPSMDALTAGKAVAGRLIGKGTEDAVEQLTQNKAIIGTLMGAGVNPAINTGIGLATGQGLPSGSDLAAQVAGGAVFSRQAKWAEKLIGHGEPAPEVTNGNDTTTTKEPVGDMVTAYTKTDAGGNYTIGNKSLKSLFLKQFAEPVKEITDPVAKAEAQTRNEMLRNLHPDDMREQLHRNAMAEKARSIVGDTSDVTLPWNEPNQEVTNSPRPAKTSDIIADNNLTQTEAPIADSPTTPKATSRPSDAPVSQNTLRITKDSLLPSNVGRPEVKPSTAVEGELEAKAANAPTNDEPKSQAELTAEQYDEKGNVNAKPEEDPAKPKFIGTQPAHGHIPATDYYNLTKPILNEDGSVKHGVGSTVSEHTLRKHGVEFDPKGVAKPSKLSTVSGDGKIGIPFSLQAYIRNGIATTGGVLQSLSNTEGHPFQALAKALYNAADKTSLNVKWQHDPTLDIGGARSHYAPSTDSVNIGTRSMADARVVIEEAVHSLTSKKIPHFAGRGEQHYKNLKQYLKTGSNEHVKNLIQSYFDTAKALGIHDQLFVDRHPDMVGGLSDRLKRITIEQNKGLAGNPDASVNSNLPVGHSTKYAMGNLDEFLAQAMKDPEFQRVLDNIESNDDRSVWQNIVDAVKNLLELNPKDWSMLDEVLRTSGELVHQERDGSSDGQAVSGLPKLKQTDTPEFKNWFGKSVLKDNKGKPLVLYHGSRDVSNTESFKPNTAYTYGEGIYFTPEPDRAGGYAGYRDGYREAVENDTNKYDKYRGGESPGIIPAHVRIENPFVTSSDAGITDLAYNLSQKNKVRYDEIRSDIAENKGYSSKEAVGNNEVGNYLVREMGHDGIIKEWKKGEPIEVVAFQPEQVKSATGNRGTFDPNEKSIVKAMPDKETSRTPHDLQLPPDRYMGKVGNVLRAVTDKVRDIGSAAAKLLADSATRALNKETELKGRWKNAIVQAGENLNKVQKDRIMAAFNHEMATKTSGLPLLKSAAERQFYVKARQLLDDSGKHRLAIGEPVTEAKVLNGKTIYAKRDLKQDEHYFPGMANQKVQQVYRNNTDHAAIEKLDKEFHEYNTKTLGLSPDASSERIANYKIALQGSIKNSDMSHQDYYNAHRKAQGTPLPPSFREQDPVRNLERYFDRAAIDASHYEHMEKDHKVLAALGQTKDAWNNKVVPEKGVSSIANNPAVKAMLEHWKGEPVSPAEGNESSLSSLVSSAFISGPALELHKTVSNIVKTLSLSSNPVVLAKAVGHAVSNINSGYQHAVENGVVKLTARSVSQLLDGSSTAAERMQSLARIIRKVSTLNDLTTKVSTGLVQSMNEVIIPSKISRAAAGDVTAQKFLRNLDPSYSPSKVYSPEEVQQLASRSASYIHGTGDIRSMPAWMLNDSEFSGFFSLAHWSIAQTNNFMKDVYEPARRGDIKPLLTGVFGAAVGGYLIKELRQDIQGKKSEIPSLKEIASSDKGLEGNHGLLAYNMITAMQFAGFGGLLSQVAKYPFDAAYKNNPQGATFPMDEVASDLATTLHQVSTAIANDPNVNWVDLAKAVTMHTLSTNFQLSRIAINQGINNGLITGMPAEKKLLSDKMGQLRRFDMAEGLPYNEIDEASNPYMNIEQKKFKMEQDPKKAMEQLPSLVSNIMETYHGNPDVMMSKLKSLKQNSYDTFPSLEQMPLSFMKYVGYLQRMEGPEAAQAEIQDYMKHKIINEAKGSVVP